MTDPTTAPGPDTTGALHQALIDTLIRDGHVRSPAVEAAFRTVPRHLFLPGVPVERVYQDEAIPTKRRDGVPISSSSQPAAMAIMLEQLDVRPGHRVLEIGAGTGYNAALLAHLAGEAGEVVTVDIDEDIVAGARAHLQAAGFQRVHVVQADGGLGYPARAPYDRIILTVGAWDIAPAWQEQLAPGGRLLIPLWLRGTQLTIAFEPAADHLTSVSVSGCAFMRLRGAFAGPEGYVPLGPDPGLQIAVEARDQIDPDAVYALLASPHRELPVEVGVVPNELWAGLSLWLALREQGFCNLSIEGDPARHPVAPSLFRFGEQLRWTIGLLGDASLALLNNPSGTPLCRGAEDAPAVTLNLCSFGKDDSPARRLADQLAAWNAAGRPSDDGLRIRAYPMAAEVPSELNAFVLDKRWNRLVIDRPRS